MLDEIPNQEDESGNQHHEFSDRERTSSLKEENTATDNRTIGLGRRCLISDPLRDARREGIGKPSCRQFVVNLGKQALAQSRSRRRSEISRPYPFKHPGHDFSLILPWNDGRAYAIRSTGFSQE